MRNGMSAKEIYDSLDQLDRLKSAFDKERTDHEKLKRAIDKAISEMIVTAGDYTMIAYNAHDREAITKLEFSSRSSGLLEACNILRKFTNPKGE